MKNINKYFIVAIVLFVTGSVWCARTVTTAEAKTRTRRAPIRRKPTRQQIAQQKTAAINEPMQDQTEENSLGLHDIKETKTNVIISVPVVGFKLDDITVEVNADNYMNISAGEIKITDERGLTTIYPTDAKTFPLPYPVNAKKMVKKISNGVLTITLPKL